MQVDILTPDRTIFSGEAISVVAPGTSGSFEVLNQHAALISTLGKGELKLRTSEKVETYKVEGGVVEVLANKVVVLVESIEA
jgi:F-type H+-transporting ATPase subunit epsilon